MQVSDFFTQESADYLYKIHMENKDWNLAYNEGDNFYESSIQQIQAVSPRQQQKFMNSEDVLNMMRTLTGETAIRKADSYASIYAPGHFLTAHDDRHDSHDRVAAYVVSMTKTWNKDWGGHLAFFDDDGNITEALIPSFNTLNIFLVPQMHSVQLVSPFAGNSRTSYLGWLHR